MFSAREPNMSSDPYLHIPGVEALTAKADDGITIAYERLGKGERCLVLCNGLGGRLYSWKPLVDHFRERFRILTWDYRGLFSSGLPPSRRLLSVPHHALDARAVLDQEGIEKAVLIGWSMGVQVALEGATLYPERISQLVLINGTHGHALETGFQPIFRLPWVARLVHRVIDEVRDRPDLIDLISRVAMWRWNVDGIGALLARIWKNPSLVHAYRQYLTDIFSDQNFRNYLGLFQELDAHSVLHHLRDIPTQTLLISGRLDFLTPAYQSFEMARRLRNVEHLHLPFGSHFVLLEYPKLLVDHIERFIESGA
jgi:pimeloyl-ACP methyl ester carboxylesterase